MTERYKTFPIEDSIASLAIPGEAVSLDEMVKALVAEEEMLKPEKQPINTALREVRAAKGLTQQQLGKRIGISNVSIGHLETLRQFPNDEQAAGIARVLETNEDKLFPPYLQVFVRSHKPPSQGTPEMIPLQEVSEEVIIETVERTRERTDFFSSDAAEVAMECFLQEAVEDALDSLSSRRRRIIELMFGLRDEKRHTLEEVGAMYGVTGECIRGYKARIFEKLKKDRTLREFYGQENKNAHETKEALINGVINAIYQKDFKRAQQNIEKIEYQKLFSEDLSFPEREIVEEIRQYPSLYRWSKETISRFIAWSSSKWSDSQKKDFPIRADVLTKVIVELKEVWRLKAQIPVKPTV